jgi:hypothetical protein
MVDYFMANLARCATPSPQRTPVQRDDFGPHAINVGSDEGAAHNVFLSRLLTRLANLEPPWRIAQEQHQQQHTNYREADDHEAVNVGQHIRLNLNRMS